MKKVLLNTLICITILLSITGCKVTKKENNSTGEIDTKAEIIKSNEKNINYSKTIDNIKIDLNIPSGWKYEEIKNDNKDDFYIFAVKLYKNDENQYAMLYIYNNPFSVCGTGRKTEDIILNNGKNSIVGYYDNSKYWSDISFFSINENIAVINNNLKDNEADEVINFIKTLNITEVN